MQLEVLVYSPLLEEETTEGWQKATIDYLITNKNKAVRSIYSTARKMKTYTLHPSDIDEIYQEALMYFYKHSDYREELAVAEDGTIIPIEAYVHKILSYCTMRNLNSKYEIQKQMLSAARAGRNDGGRELLDRLSTIADPHAEADYEQVHIDLEAHCHACQHLRYLYGADIYLLWYVRLLTMVEQANDKYMDILAVLGLQKDLRRMEARMCMEGVMAEFAQSIARAGLHESIGLLERYVYGAENIKAAVHYFASQKCQLTAIGGSRCERVIVNGIL